MTTYGGTHNVGTIFSEPVTGGTPNTLYSFDGTHGSTPFGSLILSGSTLFGMTEYGGSNNYGTIFSISTDGTGLQDLYNFSGTDGQEPGGDLAFSGSTLYGMTASGGSNGQGVIFDDGPFGVPEPSSLTLLASGAVMGLIGWATAEEGGPLITENIFPAALEKAEKAKK